MTVRIGSFNVRGMGNHPDQEKEQRIEMISKVLKDEGFDLIALQEVQNPEAVKRIASGLGGFESCHSIAQYMELNGQGFQNRNASVFKPEYAFLWNPNILVLERDPEIYKGISERVSILFDAYVGGIAATIAGILFGLKAKKKKKKDRRDDKEDDKQEDTMLLKTLSCLGLGGLVSGTLAAANAIRQSDDASREEVKRQISDTLQKTLRPPLIGIFKKQSSGRVGGKDIRIINMHTFFGDKSRKNKELREKELDFVLGDIFDVVATQRDGKWRSPTTIVAGDYNMSLAEIRRLEFGRYLRWIHRNRLFATGQGELSIVSIANKDGVLQGDPPVIKYDSDYDHFSYDASNFTKGDPVFSRFNCTNENFIANSKLISDHVPVKMIFEF